MELDPDIMKPALLTLFGAAAFLWIVAMFFMPEEPPRTYDLRKTNQEGTENERS